MSRHTYPLISIEMPEGDRIEYEVAYGYDRTLGYFLDIYNLKTGEFIAELSTAFTGLTGPLLQDKLGLLRCPNASHMTEALFDLPISD